MIMYVGRSGNRSELETLIVVCPSTDSLGESMRSTARGYATSEGQDSQEKKECFIYLLTLAILLSTMRL